MNLTVDMINFDWLTRPLIGTSVLEQVGSNFRCRRRYDAGGRGDYEAGLTGKAGVGGAGVRRKPKKAKGKRI